MQTSTLRGLAARLHPLPQLALLYLAIGAATRAVLWRAFGAAAGVPASGMPAILAAGVLNDAVESLYLLVPLALWLALMPERARRSLWNRRLLAAGTAIFAAALVFIAVSEYYFFEEFAARFNVVAFDYLAYPTEVVGDLWQEYPVLRAMIVAALLGLACGWRALRTATPAPIPAPAPGLRVALLAGYVAALVLAAVAWPTDRLSGFDNRESNELAQNGLSSFARAVATHEIDYEDFYASADPGANLELLKAQLATGGGLFAQAGGRDLLRRFAGTSQGLGQLNVVLVSCESLGAEFSRLHGSARNLTPNLDAFGRQGLWFANAYASGTRTVRGLEALTSSFPPIPTTSILRRPGNEHIATWGSVMSGLGYRTSFLYGGNGYFDNMNHFYASNGFEVLDRAAIHSVRFGNVWGVSDEDLFDRALEHFDELHASGKPFFSIVMTTSNHKPYTFRKGLESLGIPERGGGRAAGVRYADFALGRFLRDAKRHAWFDDTLFVVVADHGARVYGSAEIPMESYEIPLLVYAPAHLAARRIETLTTQIDVAPTVLGLLGLPYRAPFFGQDVLTTPAVERIALFNHNHDVAIYRDGQMVVLGLQKSVRTYAYDAHTRQLSPAPPNHALARLGVAYFQTASDLFRDHRYLP